MCLIHWLILGVNILNIIDYQFCSYWAGGTSLQKRGGCSLDIFKRTLEIITRLYFVGIVLYYNCLKFWSLLRSTNSPFSAQYPEKLLVAFAPDRATGNDDDDDIKRYQYQRSQKSTTSTLSCLHRSLPHSLWFIQGLYPFPETNFQDFSRTQIDFSRVLKFTLTPTIPRSQC